MGQGGYNSNDFGRNCGKRSQRQTSLRYLAALGCLVFVIACAESQSKPSVPTKAKVATVSAKKKPASKKLRSKKLALQTGSKPQTLPDHFDKDLAWQHLIRQVDFGPRMPGTKAHDDAQQYIVDECKKYADDVRIEKFTHTWSKNHQVLPMRNIYATQNWKNATVRVVLLTHWDSRAEADQDRNPANRNKPIPAANDGASGVAVMLELMRVLKIHQPSVGILYFFTDGEDLGPDEDEMYLGSLLFADDLDTMKPRPTYGILLDMIGDANLSIPMETRSMDAAPDLMTAFYSHAKQIGLGDTFQMQTGYTMDDDHVPLIQHGLPTIDLIDFDYKWWHTMDDTPAHCSAESLGKVGKMLESWFTLKNPWRPNIG